MQTLRNLFFVVVLFVSFNSFAEESAVIALPAGSVTSQTAGSGTVATAQATPVTPAMNFMSFAPFILMFGVVYFLMIRPQQKKMKEQQTLLASLKEGDEVVTTSGFLGKIAGITEKVVTVEIADKVKVKMMKSQVQQVVKGSIKELTA